MLNLFYFYSDHYFLLESRYYGFVKFYKNLQHCTGNEQQNIQLTLIGTDYVEQICKRNSRLLYRYDTTCILLVFPLSHVGM